MTAAPPARQLPSSPRRTPRLGVEGTKVYLQVKGVTLSSSKIPISPHVSESQAIPPDSEPAPTDPTALPPTNATFTKSRPELSEILRDAGANQVSRSTRDLEKEVKRGGIRSGKRVKFKDQKLEGITASESSRTPPKAVCSTGPKRKVLRVKHGRGGGATTGRRELQRLLQTRKRHQFLSQKYGEVWMRKVFGRVLPSVARRHREQRLKRRSFVVWCRVWWSARREWKLNIRADCHNRYRLWILVWKNWTEFVRRNKRKKAVKRAAISHNKKRVVRRVWSGWCRYQRERRERQKSRETALQWHLTRTLRTGFVRWKEGLQRKHERDVMFANAVHHWTTKLQTKAWVHWVRQYEERLAVREKIVVAEQHWATRQHSSCWAAWVVYTEHRRRRKHMNGVAVEKRKWCLLRRQFSVWQESLERARELSDFQGLVEEMGNRAVERRALTQWRHYMELVVYEEHLMHIASSHYHTSLKYKAVLCLRGYLEKQQLQKSRKTVADGFRHRKVLEHSWGVWLQRCDHREEIKMLPHTRRARHHFRQCALKQFFPVWKTFVVLRRHRKAQLTLAHQHFKSTALPKCFAALRENAAIQSYKRDLLCHAQSFRRENLLSLAFYQWWRGLHARRELNTMERVAVLHSEGTVKRASIRKWRTETQLRVRQLSLEHSAVLYCQQRLLSAALGHWRDQRRHCVVSRQQYVLAQTHHTNRSMRQLWIAWGKYVERRRESKARSAQGRTHYHTTLLHRALKGWQVYHCCAVRKRGKRNKALQFYCVSLERHIVRQWRENVQWYRVQRDMFTTALDHFEMTTCRKCFSWWREQTMTSLDTAWRERERLCEISSTLAQRKLARVLASWKERTNSSVARRIAYERAVVHSHRRLLHHCFAAWYSHHRLVLRKMLLLRQCAHFLRSRLLSTFYAKWRLELMRAVVVKQKTVVALWHWSQSLQRKALVCWLMYVMNRRRKAERYAQAMKRHRSRLLHIGVSQWIEFATSMQAQREESAVQQQTQTTHSVMQCVMRCARKWRDAARKRTRTQLQNTRAQTKVFQSSLSEDIWTAIARKHEISDGHSRPQPRQPRFQLPLAGDSHLVSDAHPRLNIPHPLTPPTLYQRTSRHRGRGAMEGVVTTPTFTFLPSTVSVESPSEHQVQHSATETHCRPLQPDGPHSTNDSLPLHHCPHPVLLPPSAFIRPSSTDPPPRGHREGRGPAVDHQRGVGGLGDPAVRSQIVHVRDELRRYHQVRLKQKSLEQQVARLGETGSSTQLAEIQAELTKTVEDIHRTHPIILELVAQVHHHLSEHTNKQTNSSES